QFKKSLKKDFHISLSMAANIHIDEKHINRDQEHRIDKIMYAQLNDKQQLIADKIIATTSKLNNNDNKDAKLIKKAEVIIWNEASMAFCEALEVNKIGFRDLMQTEQLFK
ncbi:15865_t:CDS:2, partial [Cetraspora pellucida]